MKTYDKNIQLKFKTFLQMNLKKKNKFNSCFFRYQTIDLRNFAFISFFFSEK